MGGDEEKWNEAWRCICRGIKKVKADTCPSVWMSEYYCKYCEPTERKLALARKRNALIKQRNKKNATGGKKDQERLRQWEQSCKGDLDDLLKNEKQLMKKCNFTGKEFHGTLGFPRGNFLPPLKTRIPKDWQPQSVTECPETRLQLAGACPCCGQTIPKDQMMMP